MILLRIKDGCKPCFKQQTRKHEETNNTIAMIFERRKWQEFYPDGKLWIDGEIDELEAYKAEKDTESGYAWCSEFCDIVERRTCSKDCINYVPRNGKSGCCCNYKSTYDVGEKVVIKLI